MANYGFKGWIKLWREEMHNPLYDEEPFTKWQAWIDLQLQADDEGIIKTSLETLRLRWKWKSVKRVRNLMGTLQDMDLVTIKGIKHVGTEIRITDRVSATSSQVKKAKKGIDKGIDKGTIKGNQELLHKEVSTSASLEVSRVVEGKEDDSWIHEVKFDD